MDLTSKWRKTTGLNVSLCFRVQKRKDNLTLGGARPRGQDESICTLSMGFPLVSSPVSHLRAVWAVVLGYSPFITFSKGSKPFNFHPCIQSSGRISLWVLHQTSRRGLSMAGVLCTHYYGPYQTKPLPLLITFKWDSGKSTLPNRRSSKVMSLFDMFISS